MSKKNPAFLFYFGDAARDVSSLNRLERGCYYDLIQAHFRFHRFTMEQIRKILGKDFNACWNSLELILDVDENGLYYLEWVTDSIQKRKKNCTKQEENINKRWEALKKTQHIDCQESNGNNGNTVVSAWNKNGINSVIPLETETEIVNNISKSIKENKYEDFNNLKEENFEKKIDYVFCMQKIYEKNWEEYRMCLNGQAKFLNEEIFDRWKNFVDLVSEKFTSLLSTKFISPIDFGKIIKDEKFTEEKWEEVLKEILATGAKPEHELFFRIPKFMEIVKNKKNGNNNRKIGTSEGQISAARKFATGEY